MINSVDMCFSVRYNYYLHPFIFLSHIQEKKSITPNASLIVFFFLIAWFSMCELKRLHCVTTWPLSSFTAG